MVDVPSLPQQQRLLLAELSGVARRHGTGDRRDVPRDVAVATVRAVTDDPVLLGVQAGVALVDPHGINRPIVELLQAAGANMAVAEQHAAEVRERLRL
ncbi:hypothetical protein [Salinispora arenicola]|uniref:hypothetical protein n=1 Tax=Salinispora arenicola TaxID=168697 RepID=UPI0016AA47FE|nr:hypothetical protein [Salinispora arenicola]NIL62687.1 hypothetical protein [Salinispora arenicola]